MVRSARGHEYRNQGSQPAAIAVGVDPARVKRQVFVISAGLAAVTGSLYVHYASLAHPGSFDLFQAINVLVGVVVGGMQTVWGGPVGAVFVTLVPEWIQRVLPGARAGQVEQIVFGLVLMVVMVVRPGGLTGLVGDTVRWVSRQFRRRVSPAAAAASPTAVSPGALSPGFASPGFARLPASGNGAVPRRTDSGDQPILELAGVARSFGGLRALQPLDLSVDRGSITALIGPNGAGKTTAFNCISGALRPDAGTVTLDGARLDTVATHDVVRRGLVRTFQNVQLFRNMTAVENVMAGCHSWTGAGPVEAALRIGRHRRGESQIPEAAAPWLGFVGLGRVASQAASAALSGRWNLLMTSSPMVLMTLPPYFSVTPDSRSTQVLISARATVSPNFS